MWYFVVEIHHFPMWMNIFDIWEKTPFLLLNMQKYYCIKGNMMTKEEHFLMYLPYLVHSCTKKHLKQKKKADSPIYVRDIKSMTSGPKKNICMYIFLEQNE
jgi:hypothetical protein